VRGCEAAGDQHRGGNRDSGQEVPERCHGGALAGEPPEYVVGRGEPHGHVLNAVRLVVSQPHPLVHTERRADALPGDGVQRRRADLPFPPRRLRLAASVVPRDDRVEGPPGRVKRQSGLGEAAHAQPGDLAPLTRAQHLAHARSHRRPQRFGVVLAPAGARVLNRRGARGDGDRLATRRVVGQRFDRGRAHVNTNQNGHASLQSRPV